MIVFCTVWALACYLAYACFLIGDVFKPFYEESIFKDREQKLKAMFLFPLAPIVVPIEVVSFVFSEFKEWLK